MQENVDQMQADNVIRRSGVIKNICSTKAGPSETLKTSSNPYLGLDLSMHVKKVQSIS
jgi:hypothetical protein